MNLAARQHCEEQLARLPLPLGEIAWQLGEALQRGELTVTTGTLDNPEVGPQWAQPVPVMFLLAGDRVWTTHGLN